MLYGPYRMCYEDLETILGPLMSAFIITIDDFSQAMLSIFDFSIEIDADWRDHFTLNIT